MKPGSSTRFQPVWKGSLLLFGLLIALVMAAYFRQIRQVQQTFLERASADSELLAQVIESNARNALLSQESIEKIIRMFLGNTARFLDYLDGVEPFSADELSQFALENGISGIRIIRETGIVTEGPAGMFPDSSVQCGPAGLVHVPSEHLYRLTWHRNGSPGCVLLGLSSLQLEKLQDQIGLPGLVQSLSGLPGILYVRLEDPDTAVNSAKTSSPLTVLRTMGKEQVAETRIPFGSRMLVTGLDTRHYRKLSRQIWNEFFFFGAILAFLGVLFSWLLHRSQTKYLNRIREVERELARQREDAALGRATAAITHEIRNPLNAIGMGLQRLQIEVTDLDSEYQELVSTMLRAVQRTNGIVSDLRGYAGPAEPQKQPVRLDTLLVGILGLYRQKCLASCIEILCDISADTEIMADPRLLEQVLENLVKNSIEAQPDGGFLRVKAGKDERGGFVIVENSGFGLPPEQAERILEPYYTTKTRGTGLGLSIVKKIVSAHGGELCVDVPESGILRITVRFPGT